MWVVVTGAGASVSVGGGQGFCVAMAGARDAARAAADGSVRASFPKSVA